MLVTQLSPGTRAVFTTREGGVSRPPYGAADGGGGLNLGLHVGDDPAAVIRNRELLGASLGVSVEWMDQVHGRDVCLLEAPSGESAVGVADALIVGPGLPRGAPAVLVADCVPVLLATESGSHRAAVHVGRKGLMLGVLPAAVEKLAALSHEDVYAALGPHICGACYEVSAALANEAAHYGAETQTRWGTSGIDLRAGVRAQLAGIAISDVILCTFEDARFYSYRRDSVTGRCAGIAVLA